MKCYFILLLQVHPRELYLPSNRLTSPNTSVASIKLRVSRSGWTTDALRTARPNPIIFIIIIMGGSVNKMFVQFIHDTFKGWGGRGVLNFIFRGDCNSKPASGCSVQYMRRVHNWLDEIHSCLWEEWIISLVPGAFSIYFSSSPPQNSQKSSFGQGIFLLKRQQRWGSCSNNSSLLNNTKWRWLLCAI